MAWGRYSLFQVCRPHIASQLNTVGNTQSGITDNYNQRYDDRNSKSLLTKNTFSTRYPQILSRRAQQRDYFKLLQLSIKSERMFFPFTTLRHRVTTFTTYFLKSPGWNELRWPPHLGTARFLSLVGRTFHFRSVSARRFGALHNHYFGI